MAGRRPWDFAVFDEAHVLRNPRSQVAAAARAAGDAASQRLCMSGTPLQNRPDELWPLFELLLPGYLGPLPAFAAEYQRPLERARSAGGADAVAEGRAALDRLTARLRPFLLRRTKADALPDLPPKQLLDVPCTPTAAQRAALEDLARGREDQGPRSLLWLQNMRLAAMHPALPAGGRRGVGPLDWRDSGKMRVLDRLLRALGLGADAGALVGASDDAEDGGEAGEAGAEPLRAGDAAAAPADGRRQVLVFAQFLGALDCAAELLRHRFPHLGVARIDGGTPRAERERAAAAFGPRGGAPPADGAPRVLLMTTKAAGVGLDLSGADAVIMLEHDWNPAADLQAMDRAHRVGQRRCVFVYRLLLADTVEQRIMGLQAFKERMARTVIDGVKDGGAPHAEAPAGGRDAPGGGGGRAVSGAAGGGGFAVASAAAAVAAEAVGGAEGGCDGDAALVLAANAVGERAGLARSTMALAHSELAYDESEYDELSEARAPSLPRGAGRGKDGSAREADGRDDAARRSTT